MKLVAIQDFGELKPGDTIEVPDGEDYARGYFAEAEDGETPQVPASSTPVAEGLGEAPEEHQKEEG